MRKGFELLRKDCKAAKCYMKYKAAIPQAGGPGNPFSPQRL